MFIVLSFPLARGRGKARQRKSRMTVVILSVPINRVFRLCPCGIRMTTPIRRLHSSAMLILRRKAKRDFSHAQNIEDGNFSTLLALCFDMTSCVLVYHDGVVLAVGAFDISRLLRRDRLPRPDDFSHHFGRGFCYTNVFAQAHTSSGSTNSVYGRFSRYPSCQRRITAADLDTPSDWQRRESANPSAYENLPS